MQISTTTVLKFPTISMQDSGVEFVFMGWIKSFYFMILMRIIINLGNFLVEKRDKIFNFLGDFNSL